LGVVQKQALKNSIYSYIGAGLGYVNIILLFPAFFSSEQFGLIQLLVSLSAVYSQLASVGLYNAINRYFPFFRTDDKNHKNFLSYITVIAFGGFAITTLLYIILRPLIISAYIDNSALITHFYIEIIPLALFNLVFYLFETIARVTFRTVVATFAREVALRLLTIIGILFFIFKIFTFDNFVYFYVVSYGLSALIILVQIVMSREFKLKMSFKEIESVKLRELLKYGSYNLLSGAAFFVGQKVDVLMIGSMVGLAMVGAYSLYFYIASVIYIPMRSLQRIALPVIANAWKTGDLKQISEMYRKTSLIHLIFGCLIYIGVIINRNNLFYFIKKTEYIDNFLIFPLVGFAILIDVSVGINSDIIASSGKFRFDTLFNIILLFVSIIANFIFIPIFGGIGAGIAAVVSFFTFNFLKWMFLLIKYKMQPLNHKQLIVLIIAAVSFLAGFYFPMISNVYLDLFVRSTLTLLIYGSAILIFKVSDDINQRFIVYKNFLLKKLSFY